MKKIYNYRLIIWLLLVISFSTPAFCKEILNVYIWGGEIPPNVIKQFKQQTGITVHVSFYNSNEMLYAKLRASNNIGYDVIEPSGYYVARMRKQGMITKINIKKLSNSNNINTFFLNRPYDPQNAYSIPYIWGATGIFINRKYYPKVRINSWKNFWQQQFQNRLLLLDDTRDVFSMALLSLGYSPNSNNPMEIEKAYLKLEKLIPNIKLFNSTFVTEVAIDGDANVGMAWSSDIFKAQQENPNIEFIYPKDGFVIWVDSLAIPKNAPHKKNAYKFINFLLKPKVAASVTATYTFPTTITGSRKLLPKKMRESSVLYPSLKTLARSHFQTDVNNQALMLYQKYWQLLKLGA